MHPTTLDTGGLSAKDKKIINDNPGKTLTELTEAGLSAKAYKKLSTAFELETSPLGGGREGAVPIQPIHVTPTLVKAQPATRLSSSNVGATSVWLYNNNTQNRIYMSRTAAEKLVKRNPNTYKIIG